eukprot:TRINITY_DN3936_c0_g1_i2.p1 TRINITY_DN3936_c0_g1~~TRINITY_DN3936_c0_g1_i2.p1  ORF type:complete len:280 (+),score=72.21 TRINITY_DN3936_c0_g1_i2:79-918(+)
MQKVKKKKKDKKEKKKKEKKQRKEKKRKRASSSSSSSSSSATAKGKAEQQAAVWNMALWQQQQMAGGMWPGMPGWPAYPPAFPAPGYHPAALGHAWPPVPGHGMPGCPSSQSSGLMPESQEETKATEDVSTFLDTGVEETVPVPRSMIGRVIGKKGATIAEIREKTGVWKVDATNQSNDPCQVRIIGVAEAVEKARELILELVKPLKNRYAGTDFMEISQGQIGKVIGPKGARVNEIEAKTGTKIDIDYNCSPCRVYITGSADGVRNAKQTLSTIPEEW